jgi:hypothetical protein
MAQYWVVFENISGRSAWPSMLLFLPTETNELMAQKFAFYSIYFHVFSEATK